MRLTKDFEDLEVEYLDMARLPPMAFLEVFEVRGPRLATFRDLAASTSGISRFRVMEETPDRLVCQAVIGSKCVRSLLAERGWIPTNVRASRGLEKVTLAVDDIDQARDVVNFVKANYFDFELLKITPRGVPSFSSGQGLEALGLTKRQAEVLRRAISAGYFDAHRRRTASQIANGMGIDRSTFSRHLRTALKKILSRVLE